MSAAAAPVRLSALLRRVRADRVMPLLPGVRRSTEDPHILHVNTRVARWFPMHIFHLMGYRKRRRQGAILTVARRRFDLEPPENS